MRTICLSLILVVGLGCATAFAQSGWGSAPANLSIAEFLDLQFRTTMARGETGSALNDYNLVSFYPSDSQENAFVFIIQTWRDDRIAKTNLRREVRVVGDALYSEFNAMVNHPTVAKRWRIRHPENNFVIKHVRYSDLREVLGVTLGKNTYFDQEAIRRAEHRVRARGGVWEW